MTRSDAGTEGRLHVAVDANVLSADHGGIPKYTRRVAAELAVRGDRVELLANRLRWDAGVPGCRSVGVRVKGLATWRDVALPAWVGLRRPDVLWAPESVLPRRVTGATVVTVHDLAPLIFPTSKPPAVLRAFQTSFPRSARAATLCICVSQATADEVHERWGVPSERLRVVPNGVDARFAPGDPAEARAHVRRRHGIERPYVLHVGSLEPRKGLDVLIEAAALAPWQLVLAGRRGYEGDRLAAAVRAVGGLALGPVDDAGLVALYRGAEAVAAPAVYEGFGIVPLEAMACGTPVVVSAGAGALEEVAGPAAVAVDRRTPEAWRGAIAEAIARRRHLEPLGLKHARRFSWPAVAGATRVVLVEAVARHREGA